MADDFDRLFPFRGYTQPIRFTQESWLLGIADAVAQRGTCGRLRVGALLVKDGHILSTGYNGAAAGEVHCQHLDREPCGVSVHAEANALIFAAKYGQATAGAHLYITHAPCYACAGLLINAGIEYVRYRWEYRNRDGIDRLTQAGTLCDGGS